ncbi:hypothetical protein AVEN_180987-1 [Araneus ventricosus]|uniref:Uncharacterized protein n=1 Tax=Araneus ventricosus TaxID=182803 RepID=A0A4Y2UGG7_ARAVE|nr:hypothetical protein AVEN_180987-1 [Araneus ventricosus]
MKEPLSYRNVLEGLKEIYFSIRTNNRSEFYSGIQRLPHSWKRDVWNAGDDTIKVRRLYLCSISCDLQGCQLNKDHPVLSSERRQL